jgi:hypothetical protein
LGPVCCLCLPACLPVCCLCLPACLPACLINKKKYKQQNTCTFTVKAKSKQKSKHVHVHGKREDKKNICTNRRDFELDFYPICPFREMI